MIARINMLGGMSTLALASCLCSMADPFDYHSGAPEQHWPAVFYGPDGQQEVFNGPLEVPEGWHDHPSKVGDDNAKTEIPGYEDAVAAANLDAEEGEEEEEDTTGEGEGVGAEHGQQGEKNTGAGDRDVNIQAAAGENSFVLPEKGKMSKDDITKMLTARKVSFNKNWNEGRLYDLLKDTIGVKATGPGLQGKSEGNSV